jgi:putative ABC transport system ATP-binding protein
MISIQNLKFNYSSGDFQLDISKFEIAGGEKVAVIGPSGSGKTTLLNLLAGIILPVQGSVIVDDVRVNELPDTGRRDFRIATIGFVFQDFELLDYLNVLDNILHPYRITAALGLNSEVKTRAADLAGEMGIGDKLKRRVNDLSQGEKQRTAICRAMLPLPKLILADEATGNLDPDNKTLILDLLFRTVAEHDTTLLAVTHDFELLARFDRVIDFSEFRSG